MSELPEYWQQAVKPRVLVRTPTLADRAAFIAAVRCSRALHRPWVSAPATEQAYRRYLKRIAGKEHRGFLVVDAGGGDLIGIINLNNIILGAFRSAFLGYYAFAGGAGRGLMHDGLRLVMAQAFRKLKLHRLEANIQPGNRASIALARKCGLRREGFSRRYLKVRGRWKDHERWAICVEDFTSSSR